MKWAASSQKMTYKWPTNVEKVQPHQPSQTCKFKLRWDSILPQLQWQSLRKPRGGGGSVVRSTCSSRGPRPAPTAQVRNACGLWGHLPSSAHIQHTYGWKENSGRCRQGADKVKEPSPLLVQPLKSVWTTCRTPKTDGKPWAQLQGSWLRTQSTLKPAYYRDTSSMSFATQLTIA